MRVAAPVAVVVGALGSVGLMMRAGRHNQSRFLLFLFSIWVLFPFVAFLMTYAKSKQWPAATRMTLYCVMLAVSLGSLAVYGSIALGPTRVKAAPPFVVVPPVSCLLSVFAVSISAFMNRRLAKSNA